MRNVIGEVVRNDVSESHQQFTCLTECDELLTPNDNAFVAKATNLVIENIKDTSFSIDTLCREMAMSRTLFYSRLKSLTGIAPRDFIRILRLEKAADMLQNGYRSPLSLKNAGL